MPTSPNPADSTSSDIKPDTSASPVPVPEKRLRAFAYFDGQNLFNAAKRAFGETSVRYDPRALAKLICDRNSWEMAKVFFYTGVPPARKSAYLHQFWTQKLLNMKRQGIVCHERELMYRRREVRLDDGSEHEVSVAEEKGIDVKIAVDIVRHAYASSYNVALIFSQDNDLMPAVAHVRELALEQKRKVHFASAFPAALGNDNLGIRDTNWIPIERSDYEACLDKRDYDPSIQKALRANRFRRY